MLKVNTSGGMQLPSNIYYKNGPSYVQVRKVYAKLVLLERRELKGAERELSELRKTLKSLKEIVEETVPYESNSEDILLQQQALVLGAEILSIELEQLEINKQIAIIDNHRQLYTKVREAAWGLKYISERYIDHGPQTVISIVPGKGVPNADIVFDSIDDERTFKYRGKWYKIVNASDSATAVEEIETLFGGPTKVALALKADYLMLDELRYECVRGVEENLIQLDHIVQRQDEIDKRIPVRRQRASADPTTKTDNTDFFLTMFYGVDDISLIDPTKASTVSTNIRSRVQLRKDVISPGLKIDTQSQVYDVIENLSSRSTQLLGLIDTALGVNISDVLSDHSPVQIYTSSDIHDFNTKYMIDYGTGVDGSLYIGDLTYSENDIYSLPINQYGQKVTDTYYNESDMVIETVVNIQESGTHNVFVGTELGYDWRIQTLSNGNIGHGCMIDGWTYTDFGTQVPMNQDVTIRAEFSGREFIGGYTGEKFGLTSSYLNSLSPSAIYNTSVNLSDGTGPWAGTFWKADYQQFAGVPGYSYLWNNPSIYVMITASGHEIVYKNIVDNPWTGHVGFGAEIGFVNGISVDELTSAQLTSMIGNDFNINYNWNNAAHSLSYKIKTNVSIYRFTNRQLSDFVKTIEASVGSLELFIDGISAGTKTVKRNADTTRPVAISETRDGSTVTVKSVSFDIYVEKSDITETGTHSRIINPVHDTMYPLEEALSLLSTTSDIISGEVSNTIFVPEMCRIVATTADIISNVSSRTIILDEYITPIATIPNIISEVSIEIVTVGDTLSSSADITSIISEAAENIINVSSLSFDATADTVSIISERGDIVSDQEDNLELTSDPVFIITPALDVITDLEEIIRLTEAPKAIISPDNDMIANLQEFMVLDAKAPYIISRMVDSSINLAEYVTTASSSHPRIINMYEEDNPPIQIEENYETSVNHPVMITMDVIRQINYFPENLTTATNYKNIITEDSDNFHDLQETISGGRDVRFPYTVYQEYDEVANVQTPMEPIELNFGTMKIESHQVWMSYQKDAESTYQRQIDECQTALSVNMSKVSDPIYGVLQTDGNVATLEDTTIERDRQLYMSIQTNSSKVNMMSSRPVIMESYDYYSIYSRNNPVIEFTEEETITSLNHYNIISHMNGDSVITGLNEEADITQKEHFAVISQTNDDVALVEFSEEDNIIDADNRWPINQKVSNVVSFDEQINVTSKSHHKIITHKDSNVVTFGEEVNVDVSDHIHVVSFKEVATVEFTESINSYQLNNTEGVVVISDGIFYLSEDITADPIMIEDTTDGKTYSLSLTETGELITSESQGVLTGNNILTDRVTDKQVELSTTNGVVFVNELE